MRREKKDVFVRQLKAVQDIAIRINALVEKHRSLDGKLPGVLFRTVIDPNKSRLYEKGHHGRGDINKGVRVRL